MKYWIESSFESEDKPKEYPEFIVIRADYGEYGTEGIGHISLPKDENDGYAQLLKSELMDVIKRINLDKDELEDGEVQDIEMYRDEIMEKTYNRADALKVIREAMSVDDELPEYYNSDKCSDDDVFEYAFNHYGIFQIDMISNERRNDS